MYPRPRFHLTPTGWMNDPKPIYENGVYHVYFQHNPDDTHWGNMHWGHGTSPDLLHWTEEAVAIAPSEPYDANGIWTGSVVKDNGQFFAFYTSIRGFNPLRQTQSVATSDDLFTWAKHPANPLINEQPLGTGECFRDPQVWREGDGWKMVIGSQTEAGGCALLYRSSDLITWEYLGILFESPTEVSGFDMECPDFFELDGKWVLISSRHGTHWWVGDYNGLRFAPTSRGTLDLAGGDFGASYAPKTCLGPAGERLLFAWVLEGLDRDQAKAQGWCGALSLARRLRVIDGRLTQEPAIQLPGEPVTLPVTELSVATGDSGWIRVDSAAELVAPGWRQPLAPGAQVFVDSTIVEVFQEGTVQTYRIYSGGLSVAADPATQCQWVAW